MGKIIHIDMDAFFASVEQRDNPELRGRPIVVGGKPERRGVVAAASYEARKFGIHSAMASHKAAHLCPELIFVRPRFEAYKEVSLHIREIFSRHTDLIEPLSLDEAYLDVTENKTQNPSATRIAQEIKAAIQAETSLTASAGISYNKFLAKMASDMDKPDGLYVIQPQDALAFLDTLPIGKFYGIGKKTAARMEALGITDGKTLRQWSELDLIHHFGKSGYYYYAIVRGIDDRAVEPHRERKSMGTEETFDRDLTTHPEMIEALRPMAEEIVEWMNSRNKWGKTLTLKVKYHDFQQVTRSKTLPAPYHSAALLMEWAQRLLESTEAHYRPVRLLGLSVSHWADENTPKESTHPTEDSHQLTLPFVLDDQP